MNKNIKLARQLVALARELVAGRSRKALSPIPTWEIAIGRGPSDWKQVDNYDQLLKECEGADPGACVLLHQPNGKNYFNTYGAPFFVHKSNGVADAIMHPGTSQLRDIENDEPIKDDELVKTACVTWLFYCIFDHGVFVTADDPKWDEALSQCKGNFSVFKPIIENAREEQRKSDEKGGF